MFENMLNLSPQTKLRESLRKDKSKEEFSIKTIDHSQQQIGFSLTPGTNLSRENVMKRSVSSKTGAGISSFIRAV
jgi:hypothetical protein